VQVCYRLSQDRREVFVEKRAHDTRGHRLALPGVHPLRERPESERRQAREIGLGPVAGGFWMGLNMSRFLRDIIKLLPDAVGGEKWVETLS
jgi:hypothetical protein